MKIKHNLQQYFNNELKVVYPKLQPSGNAMLRDYIYLFIKRDVIAYFAPARLLIRGIFKAFMRCKVNDKM